MILSDILRQQAQEVQRILQTATALPLETAGALVHLSGVLGACSLEAKRLETLTQPKET